MKGEAWEMFGGKRRWELTFFFLLLHPNPILISLKYIIGKPLGQGFLIVPMI